VPRVPRKIDEAGSPEITPIWFLWDGAAFVMTSVRQRPERAGRKPIGAHATLGS
jgi:hypothetical protein